MTDTAIPRREPITLAIIVIIATIISGIGPNELHTWWLEASPVMLALIVFTLTYKRFPLTRLTYRLVTIHCLVCLLGAHYTYAQVPLGEWARETFELQRNNYDRIGHIAQGFIPAILMREILLRCSPLVRGKWLFTVTICICLAFSAAFELFEWLVAIIINEEAKSFLATQGDPWDTQWDMFLALLGATTAYLTLSKLHDKHLKNLGIHE